VDYLTIRGVPNDLAKALQEEKRRRGSSMNQTVMDLLRQALNLGWTSKNRNGLEKLSGSWGQKEFNLFERSTAVFEHTDEDQWR
jgi:plasmid stability protein